MAKLGKLPEVRHATYMVEGLVEGLYMPDRGFSGLPIYLTAEPDRYLRAVYHEPELGELDSFSRSYIASAKARC